MDEEKKYNLRIGLTYNGQTINVELSKFKKLENVKRQAYNLFYPIKTDIDLLYKNQSMKEHLNEFIGTIFKESSIKLTVISLEGTKRADLKKGKKRGEKSKSPQK